MKNPNSPVNRAKKGLSARWSGEDYPGAEPRFQLMLFGKDLAIFIFLPIAAVIIFKSLENASTSPKRISPARQMQNRNSASEPRSQIISFHVSGGPAPPFAGVSKRSPGSLVKLKLMNVVETYSNAPVHAQIIDGGLGRNLMGGTLLGDAVSDTNFERININFRFAKDPNRDNIAVPINARALSLDGTLGVIAHKKEGYFTRSVLGSAQGASGDMQGKGSSTDFKDILFRALAAGFIQEFSSGTQVEKNRAQVLSLAPGSEFFAELTDFFPGGSK